MAIVINGSGTVTGISVGGLPDDIVDAGTLADDAVGLAQMAAGTDGNVITYDASGNPAVVASGTSGQFLTSQGANTVPVFAAGGLTHASAWHLVTQYTPSSSNEIFTGWTETDANGYDRLGSALTYSAGVFTYPSTGWWWVQTNFECTQNPAENDNYGIQIQETPDDGSNWNALAASHGRFTGSNIVGEPAHQTVTAFHKVDDVANDKVRFYGYGLKITSSRFMVGHAETADQDVYGGCTALFMKLADI